MSTQRASTYFICKITSVNWSDLALEGLDGKNCESKSTWSDILKVQGLGVKVRDKNKVLQSKNRQHAN